MSGIVAQNTLDNTGLIKSPEAGGGAWTFIKKLTSDGSDSDLSFVDGASDVVLDSTYKEYIFYFVAIHCETDNKKFQFNGSVDSGSNYNVAKTSTYFSAYHSESTGEANLGYNATYDLAQGTGFDTLSIQQSADADHAISGYLHLFNPSSTTFVKHYIARISGNNECNLAMDEFSNGYMNTTSAVDAIQFKMDSGEIQAGSIFLHGLTT